MDSCGSKTIKELTPIVDLSCDGVVSAVDVQQGDIVNSQKRKRRVLVAKKKLKQTEKQNCFCLPIFSPILVFPHGRKERNQTLFTISDGCYYARSVPEMHGMSCIASFNEWLVMLDNYSSKCFLLNPISMEKIQLPPIEHSTSDLGILTSCPSDPNCVVMLISKRNEFLYFCRPHDEQWINHDLNPRKEHNGMESIICAINVQGKIYIFFIFGIALVDVSDTSATITNFEINLPLLSIKDAKLCSKYLAEYHGELFLVVKIFMGIYADVVETFDIFKLDFSAMVWVKVESIGDAIFLLSKSCISISEADLGIKGDCIYFLDPDNRNLYRFNMYNQTITVGLPCPNVVHGWSQPYWIVPSISLPVKQGKAKMEDTEILESRISRDKDEVSEEERPWNDLSKEILEQIISHLFVSDCIRFRLTCKGWTAITSPLRSPPPPFESSSHKSPWFMFFPYNNSGTCKFFHVMYNDTCLMDFPELQGAIIRHSKYGWLLVSGSDCSIFFFNPFTRAIIELPDLDDSGSFFTSVSFSSPPTSSNCLVFAHEVTNSKIFLMWVCRHGEFIWTPYYIDGKVPFMASHCNPIFYDNVLYILGQDGRLGVFSPDEDEDECIWRVLPKLIGPKFPIHRSFIVESDGELLSIFIGHLGSPIGVFKLDRFKMKWVKVESLGDRMLFVSHTTSILASASVKGTENKIYFPRFHGNNIVFYSLWTGKYHSFGGNFSRENWYDTDEQWYCTWIEPNFDIHSEGLNWFENPPPED